VKRVSMRRQPEGGGIAASLVSDENLWLGFGSPPVRACRSAV